MGQLQRVPHPSPAANGQDHSPLHLMERISRVRNRMRKICASGSVGGEGGNILVYPARSPIAVIIDRFAGDRQLFWVYDRYSPEFAATP
jgi:hypothetical protein